MALSNRASGFPQENRMRKMNLAAGAAIPAFSEESEANQVFPIKITNAHNAAQLICIHPGSLTSISEITKILGVTVDGIAKEGVVIVDKVTCSTKPSMVLEYFQNFVKLNPTRLMRLQVAASSEEQLNEAITIAKINPFKKLGEQVLTPSAYKKETNTNVKLVTLSPKDVQLDDQTVVYVNILPGATLTLNLSIGVISNTAATLAKQAEIFYSQY